MKRIQAMQPEGTTDQPDVLSLPLIPASAAKARGGSSPPISGGDFGGEASGLDGAQLSGSVLPALWVHEVSRELSDRIASEQQLTRMSTLVKSIAEREFGTPVGIGAGADAPDGGAASPDATLPVRLAVDAFQFVQSTDTSVCSARYGVASSRAADDPKSAYICLGTEEESISFLKQAPRMLAATSSSDSESVVADLENILRQTVLFGDATRHIFRIIRVISPRDLDEHGSE